MASGINLVVVRIPLEAHHDGGAADDPVRAQCGHIHTLFNSGIALGIYKCHPGHEAEFIDAFIQVCPIRKRRMPVPVVMQWVDHEVAILGNQVDEQWIRFIEMVPKGEIVHLDDGAPSDQPRGDGRKFRVHPDVIEGEHEIIAGQRHTVGPFEALAKMDRDGSAIRADLPAPGKVR